MFLARNRSSVLYIIQNEISSVQHEKSIRISDESSIIMGIKERHNKDELIRNPNPQVIN